MDISALVRAQREFFQTGATLGVSYRQEALDSFRRALLRREGDIAAALKADLNKAALEAYMCELGMLLDELDHARRHIRRWARDTRAPTPLAQFPAASFVHPEPYGVALIMAPWNYPILLSLQPLVGAVAAGNCAVVKPSAYAPAASQVIADIVADAFDPRHVCVVQGGRQENQTLLDQTFDYIFFTGGTEVGKLVMRKAAEHLTPVSLELGGKSPVIVDASADIPMAARRIAFGKFLNSGQTCVAPDYILVQRGVKEALARELQSSVTEFFGAHPLDCPDLVRIVNEKHYLRLQGLMEGERIVFGGKCRDGFIEPTLLDDVRPDAPIMREEIFGPILPMIEYDSAEEAIAFVGARPKPLALYLFTTDRRVEGEVLARVSFGGGCVNDTIIHLATHSMPFGGVGASGMGAYHGKYSFDTFSHMKSIVRKANHPDLPMRYHPYTDKKLGLIKRFLR